MEDSGALPSALTGYTGYLMARALARARTISKAAMPPGRHPQEMGILAALRERGPISQRRLSEVLAVNRTMMVKVIDTLEYDGLVRRERDPDDRRSYAVTLTDAGTAVLAKMHEAATAGSARITEGMPPAEHERLNALLRRLIPDTASPPADMLRHTAFLVAVTQHRLRERVKAALAALDLEARQFGALSVLADIEPSSQQRLADELGVTGPAVVGMVDDLERSGRIERTRNPDDRRAHVIRLSAKGRADLTAARAALDAIQDDLGERLGPGGVAELNELLAKIAT